MRWGISSCVRELWDGKEGIMKVDGRCHCGYITYEAEIDPEKVIDLPLLGLPDPIRLRLPHGRVHPRKYLQALVRRTKDLREDRREWNKAATILLPGMRNTDLFKYYG